VLAECAQNVTGIDLSEKMIIEARNNKKTNTEFVTCDAEKLTDYFNTPFDAVLYNASIFLLPALHKSMEKAHEILAPGGVCSANYPVSLYAHGIDILDEARKSGLVRDGSVVKNIPLKKFFDPYSHTMMRNKPK
jgi:ubiquinone/menaquinone biosynthesis C-methylase UbiE